MSRRDTIIIAVLLNAGLLIVLFAASLKSESLPGNSGGDSPTVVLAEPVVLAKVENPVQPPAIVQSGSSGDEVDQMMKQYVAPALTEGKPNFAADIQAMGSPESLATSPSVPVVEPSFKEVKVKKGDVLERIARQNRVSVEEVMKSNNLANTRLKIGQVLKIPSQGIKSPSDAVSSTPKPSDENAPKYYTVKNGDNPWTIAVKNHMKVEELLKLNNLDEEERKV